MVDFADTKMRTKVDLDVEPDFGVTPPPPAFCSALSLSEAIIFGGQDTTIETLPDNTSKITGLNDAGTTSNNTVSYSSNTFTSQSDVVHFEMKYFSSIGGASGVGFGFSDADPFTTFGDIITAILGIPAAGILIDAVTGMPVETGVTMAANVYWIALDFDTDNSVCAWKDEQGNSGSLGVQTYNNANPVYMIGVANAGDSLNDEAVVILNAGVVADYSPTVDSVKPCEAA